MLTTPDEALDKASDASAHVVRFYDHEASLLDEVAEFIDASLRAGGTGFVIATPAHVVQLRRLLAGFGSSNGAACWYPGRLVVLDAEQTLESFMADGMPDRERLRAVILPSLAEACASGASVHAFGEMVTLLCERGQYDAAVRLEQLWNEMSTEFRFSMFCAYPWHLFSSSGRAEAFARVCAEHGQCGMPHGAHIIAPAVANVAPSHEQRALALEAEIARRKEAEQTLRRREKEFADFVENAAEGLHRVAGDGIILWVNRAELQMLGYTWDEYVGHHIADFHVDPEVIASILAKLGSGETLYDQPARLRCKDGSVKHVVIHSNGYFEDGKLRYTRCFTRDATERRERDEALMRLERASVERERLLEELTSANRAKDEFLAMLGHELRNPLSPIVTALQLMRMRGETAAARERDIIERQVEHLVRLVDDLMDVARATRGQIELKSERGDIARPLAKAVEMASPLLEQRRHRLALEVEEGLEWEGDPMRLAQVVSNLLTNAARYTGNGGAVALSARRDGPDWLRISVADNGIGLAPEVLPQVFGLFFQGKRSVDRVEGGLGIGLALVKNIVELHGGTVEAHSAGLGCGSEFVVRLPVRSVASAPHAPVVSQAPPAPGRRIMVVDDNVDAAETLGMLLSTHGHTVEVFNDPAAALAAAGQLRPEIAVLDIGLPGLDGYELAGRLRVLLGDHPCRLIALTGYGQDRDKARSEAAGFEQHLVKPISPEQVARLASAP
ncbi:ATP-binding protein [Massilia sp. CMS3.1]|uniref:ATP-binding protein n=1 Tax=Massilia sp. CMS3.1 TaxID=3373083 RepID=UPI003EE56F6D